MAEITITSANFEAEVLNSDKPVLIDFWATWCYPCRMQAPILAEFAEKHPEVKVGKVNVDEEPGLAGKFGVTGIPMLVLMRGGKVANYAVGTQQLGGLEALLK